MENINVGIVNLFVSSKLKDSFFDNNLIEESKKTAHNFFNIIKNSPTLQLEYKVFNNIENKYIENDQIATRYIDNNIKLFEVYTIEEIETERNKLKSFIDESIIPDNNEKIQLYSAIDNLIKESLKISDDVDVDNVHESFTYVLNYIKSPKKELIENIETEIINENVIEIAVEKFNEKYSSLDENDRNLLKTLINSSTKEKKILLETYKTETLSILEEVKKDDVQDNIDKAIQKIKEMVYDKKTVDDNIISLHELKKELL